MKESNRFLSSHAENYYRTSPQVSKQAKRSEVKKNAFYTLENFHQLNGLSFA